MTFLDNLPASLRHFLFSAAAVLLALGVQYVQSAYTTWDLPTGVVAAIGAILPLFVAYVTPLTKQYGVGSQVSSPDLAVQDDGTEPPA